MRVVLQMLVVFSGLGLIEGNSFTPPLQLHPCVDGAYSQLFKVDPNGSVYSPTLSKTGKGYCLTIIGANVGALGEAKVEQRPLAAQAVARHAPSVVGELESRVTHASRMSASLRASAKPQREDTPIDSTE